MKSGTEQNPNPKSARSLGKLLRSRETALSYRYHFELRNGQVVLKSTYMDRTGQLRRDGGM